jgi:hypothetical protein
MLFWCLEKTWIGFCRIDSTLLGSTPSPFTKNPFVSNFQVDIANKCKESDSLPEFIANECKKSDSLPEFTANECRESESLPEFIANECKETDSLPELMLITTTKQPCQDVFYREQQLQLNFKLLHKRFPDNIKQLSRFYRHQAAIIETDRFRYGFHRENLSLFDTRNQRHC